MRAVLASVLVLAIASVLAFAGLRLLDGTEASADGLTVFAAASLRDVAEPLASAWFEQEPDSPLRFSFAGSNVLSTQIAEGARPDVFLSADLDHAHEARISAGAAGAVTRFAGNELAIVAADESDLVDAVDLAAKETRLVAAGDDVPISRYAADLLDLLAITTDDADGFLAAVSSNVVSREDNVRGALAKVELGEADAAIVYASDALTAESVETIPLPAGVNVMAAYGALQVSDTDGAADFVTWLGGPEAQRILAAAGFHPPPS